MPYHRAIFPTASDAQSGVLTMVENLKASYQAAATDAGSPTETIKATTATRVQSSQPLPAGAGDGYNRVSWEIATPFGLKEVVASSMPEAQAPTPVAVSGKVRFEKTTDSTITVTSRIAAQIRIQKLDTTGAIGTGLRFEDPATGKQYDTTSGVAGGQPPAFYEVSVSEVTSTETSNVTHGTPLICMVPPSNMNGYAQVSRMKGFTVNTGVTLTDSATGYIYTVTGGPFTLADTAAARLAGDHKLSTIQVRGPTNGPNVVAVDTSLTFGTTPTNARSTATVATAPTSTIPLGTTFVRSGTPNRTMKTTAAIVIGDASKAEAPFVAVETTPFDPVLAVSSTSTVSPSVSGVSTTATITEVTPDKPFPVSYGAQLFGDEPTWKTIVKPTLDGRWLGIVFTEPLGT
jgi:hypothetical protein